MTTISARVLADSVNPVGVRLTTVEATYPRSIHAEVMTHRMFSRNTASSRAIPLRITLRRVQDDPFAPVHWGKNQKGMQAESELDAEAIEAGKRIVLGLRDQAIAAVRELEALGVHKQLANRYLEPWLWHTAIITATEWSNFFNLRDHQKAEPHFWDLAYAIRAAYNESTPKALAKGEWHLPLIQPDEMATRPAEQRRLAQLSAARSARVSYLTHDGRRDSSADLSLYSDKLLADGDMSPLEHPAMACAHARWIGNFRGWRQLRKTIPGEADILTYRQR